eukprot:4318628-Pyramimonas_sp.AAC.1
MVTTTYRERPAFHPRNSCNVEEELAWRYGEKHILKTVHLPSGRATPTNCPNKDHGRVRTPQAQRLARPTETPR